MDDRNSPSRMSASIPEHLESLMAGIAAMKDSARQLETNVREKQIGIESLMAEITAELDGFLREAGEQNSELDIALENLEETAQNWQVAIAEIAENVTSDIPILQDQLTSVKQHVVEGGEALENASAIARAELEKRPGRYRAVVGRLKTDEGVLSLHVRRLRDKLEAVKIRICDRVELLSREVGAAEKTVGDRVQSLNEIFAEIEAEIEAKFDDIYFDIVQNTADRLRGEGRDKIEIELTESIEVAVGGAIASLDRLTERLAGDREDLADRREAISDQFEELEELLNELKSF